MTEITGARFLAEVLEGYGVTHVFFVPMVLSHTLAEMEKRTSIKRIMPAYGGTLHGDHGELWQFSDVDFACIAESMGAKGIRVEKPCGLVGALEQAFASNRPCVVEVVTEVSALAPLAWTGEGEARAE